MGNGEILVLYIFDYYWVWYKDWEFVFVLLFFVGDKRWDIIFEVLIGVGW